MCEQSYESQKNKTKQKKHGRIGEHFTLAKEYRVMNRGIEENKGVAFIGIWISPNFF